MKPRGLLVVISGPSGSGKGTVVNRVFEKSKDFSYSISATSRAPRPGETDGVHYHFKTRQEFEHLIQSGMVLEYTEYCGNYYGTLKSSVDGKLEQGINVVLEIEVNGALQVKAKYPETILVMLTPPNITTLEKRLRDRGTNDEEDIKRRLMRTCDEMRFFNQYDYFIVNEDGKVDECADEFINIINSELHKTSRNVVFADKFFNKK